MRRRDRRRRGLEEGGRLGASIIFI